MRITKYLRQQVEKKFIILGCEEEKRVKRKKGSGLTFQHCVILRYTWFMARSLSDNKIGGLTFFGAGTSG